MSQLIRGKRQDEDPALTSDGDEREARSGFPVGNTSQAELAERVRAQRAGQSGNTSADGDADLFIRVGGEIVHVSNMEEREDANRIIYKLIEEYDINIDSDWGRDFQRDKWGKHELATPELIEQVEIVDWEYKELVALEKALDFFAPLLGDNRDNSDRAGTPQEVTSLTKLSGFIEERRFSTGKKLEYSDDAIGEYWGEKQVFAMYASGTDSEGNLGNMMELEATAIHEMAHGFFAHKYDDWVKRLVYWLDMWNYSYRVSEKPPTEYGKKSAREDLCESVAYYFLDPTFKDNFPERAAILKEYMAEWTAANTGKK